MTKKKTIVVLLAIAAAAVILLYWDNYNAAPDISRLRTKITKLYGFKDHQQTDTIVRDQIAEIRHDIATDRYTRVTPALSVVFEKFMTDWKQAGKLNSDLIDAHQPLLGSQFTAYAHVKGNQLLALAVDEVICIISLCLCLFSNILRDSVGDSSKLRGENYATASDDAQPPYSLARTQLMLWITIIACVYVYAVLWEGRDPGSINATALILMGISAGTFAAAAIVDTSEIQQQIPRIQDLPSTGNFFTDILSDSQGVSVQRFQNFVWTLVAIFIYFYRFANPPADQHDDILPILDNTLLALTGISSATYLTMKTRENPASPNAIPQVTITFDASASTALTNAEKVIALATGFPKAIVTLGDQAGNKIYALPDPANPGKDFLVTNINPGTYDIVFAWTGQLIPPTQRTLTGKWTGQIDANNSSPIIKLT